MKRQRNILILTIYYNIVEEAHHETPDAIHAANIRDEHPFILRKLGEVFRSKGKFFQQKVCRTKIEFECARCGAIAVHAENVDIAGLVVCFVSPSFG